MNVVQRGSSSPREAEERLHRERAHQLANTWEWWVFAIGLAALGLLVAFDSRQCEPWWLWLDNLFVATYTLFFWGHAARCYQLCTNRLPVPVTRWRIWLLFAMAIALAGALVDYAENFWLLADLSRGLVERCLWPGDELGAFTLAKFRLFGVNCVVAVAWWLAARRAAAAWAAAAAFQRKRICALCRDMRAHRMRAPEAVRRAALQELFIESPEFRSSRAEVSFSRLAVFRFMHDVLGCADAAAQGRTARRISVILSNLALEHQIAPAGDRFVITAQRGDPSNAAT